MGARHARWWAGARVLPRIRGTGENGSVASKGPRGSLRPRHPHHLPVVGVGQQHQRPVGRHRHVADPADPFQVAAFARDAVAFDVQPEILPLQAAAVAAETGQIDFAHLAQQPDATVVAELVVLPGIGQWTAEMFLLFALARPDAFSYGDLALRQGVARLYPGEDWQAVTGRWAPYRSLASRYLWADNARLRAGGAPL